MKFIKSDGGRKAAGFKGVADDCVCRAIAHATGLTYYDVYWELQELSQYERPRKGNTRSSARNGVIRATYERLLLRQCGAKWTPTMRIGQGCKVHMREDELPPGRLVVSLSKHLTAVINGVCYDTLNPMRDGFRCVYGYYDVTAFYERNKS